MNITPVGPGNPLPNPAKAIQATLNCSRRYAYSLRNGERKPGEKGQAKVVAFTAQVARNRLHELNEPRIPANDEEAILRLVNHLRNSGNATSSDLNDPGPATPANCAQIHHPVTYPPAALTVDDVLRTLPGKERQIGRDAPEVSRTCLLTTYLVTSSGVWVARTCSPPIPRSDQGIPISFPPNSGRRLPSSRADHDPSAKAANCQRG